MTGHGHGDADPGIPFAVVLRGYERAAVDARISYLESALREAQVRAQVLDDRLGDLLDETAHLRVELHQAVKRATTEQPAGLSALSERIHRILSLAEQQAEDVVTAAARHAEQVTHTAEAEAATMLAEARQETEALWQELRDQVRARIRGDNTTHQPAVHQPAVMPDGEPDEPGARWLPEAITIVA
jgi:cell division septum initiation protein DivIVA